MQNTKLPKPKGKDAIKTFKAPESVQLFDFLMSSMPSKGRNKIKSILKHRQVSINGKIVTAFNFIVEKDTEVRINSDFVPTESKFRELRIVFEDDSIIVIDKKAGLLTMATDKGIEKTAYSLLSAHVKKSNPENKIFIVHRIDRETSGLLMFAKSKRVQQLLQDNWQDCILDRTYIALVEGVVKEEKATIESYLRESKALIMYSSQDSEDGQLAITHFNRLLSNDKFSLLEVQLETGRKNQIRVHMQYIGHSIVGDKKYGSSTNPLGRIGLHANILRFIHPITNEEMGFESKTPVVFMRVFDEK